MPIAHAPAEIIYSGMSGGDFKESIIAWAATHGGNGTRANLVSATDSR
jgi:hypothetical protein